MWSEAIKVLKGEYTVRAISEHKMDQAIVFCRTKIDCDNMEQYLIMQGGGGWYHDNAVILIKCDKSCQKSNELCVPVCLLQAQIRKATSFPAFVSMAIESPMRGKTTWTASR